ncbi:MAG: hypothetical protein FJW40_07515 [Acidobacteria bacterium]|nr:hypothetical protein [Acidobacteriota bacterium]
MKIAGIAAGIVIAPASVSPRQAPCAEAFNKAVHARSSSAREGCHGGGKARAEALTDAGGNAAKTAAAPSGLRRLTTSHDWASVRKFTTAGRTAHATRRPKVSLDDGRNSRDGVNFTTRTMEYFGSPTAWGRNLRSATTARELSSAAAWTESRTLNAPSAGLSYSGRVSPRVDVRGSVLAFRHTGRTNVDTRFRGIARGTVANTVVPCSISMSAVMHVTDRWNSHTGYRFNRSTQNEHANEWGVRDRGAPFQAISGQRWEEDL